MQRCFNKIQKIFVCVNYSRNIIPIYHKSHMSWLSWKIYPNLARMCKNKFYENKIKFIWLNLFKKFYCRRTDSVSGRGGEGLGSGTTLHFWIFDILQEVVLSFYDIVHVSHGGVF